MSAGDGGAAKCERCDGCGKIASSEEGEPWTAWTSMPVNSAIALVMGLVYPVDCPKCHGSGKDSERGRGG